MSLNKYYLETKENHPNWKKEGNIVGEAGEYFAIEELICQRCNSDNWIKCRTNQPSYDQICGDCGKKYQIKTRKATKHQYENFILKNEIKISGAAYSKTIENLSEDIDYYIILYELNQEGTSKEYNILNIIHVYGEDIDEFNIKPRKPLSSTARRAGWQGCDLVFNDYQFIVNCEWLR